MNGYVEIFYVSNRDLIYQLTSDLEVVTHSNFDSLSAGSFMYLVNQLLTQNAYNVAKTYGNNVT